MWEVTWEFQCWSAGEGSRTALSMLTMYMIYSRIVCAVVVCMAGCVSVLHVCMRMQILIQDTHELRNPPKSKSVRRWTSAAWSSNPQVPETTGSSSSHEILRLMVKKSTLQMDHGNNKRTELERNMANFIICKILTKYQRKCWKNLYFSTLSWDSFNI